MDNFDLKKYLAEGKLLKEAKEIDMARSFLRNNDLEVKDINSGNEGHNLGKKFAGISDPGSDKTAYIWDGGGNQFDGKDAFYVYMPFDEDLATEMKEKFPVLDFGGKSGTYYEVTIEKKESDPTSESLNESAPGYDSRKFGEALPTLESVKAAYEAKECKCGKGETCKCNESKLNETRDEDVQTMVDTLINAMGISTTLASLVYAMSTDDAKLYLGAIMQDNELVMGDDDEADDDAMASIMMDAPDRY
jgi:hypothetical protein